MSQESLLRSEYYKKQKKQFGDEPRPLVIKALNYFKKPGKAVELGFGLGKEVSYLISQGWDVWAIDSSRAALNLLKKEKLNHPQISVF